MRLEWAFRVSGYLTLAVACLCLGQAANPFMPGLRVLAVPLLVILGVACCLEERVALPAWAANLLGIIIALGGTAWIGWQLYGRIHESGLDDVPMPAALLPFLGPLLIVLMLVKLLRPKQAVDYWVLQGLGLILVTLSCVLASEPASGILLLAYLVCGLWHLTVFHIHGETVAATGGRKKPADRARVSLTGSLVRAASWTAAALVVGLPLFLLLPRQGQTAWNPYQLFGGTKPIGAPRTIETGFNDMIDLNGTGVIEVSDEVAVTVQAEDSQRRPKLGLSPDQRWRGAVLEYYAKGRWIATEPLTRVMPFGGGGDGGGGKVIVRPSFQGAPPPQTIGLESAGRELPDLGPSQYYLTFAFQARTAGGLFLAEPVVSRPNGDPLLNLDWIPAVSLKDEAKQAPLFQELRQTLQPGVSLGRSEYRYRQVTRPAAEPGLSEPVDHFKASLEHLRKRPSDDIGIGDWTASLLDRLVEKSAYGLTKNDIEQVEVNEAGSKAPSSVEKVAVALTEYLAHSGEYTYTLERRREDPSIDPTMDFLQNVKQGHCERFAGALALMLRSQGIQARVVTGFRGAEHKGDGEYVIRQNFAHSWVEVLVERGPDGGKHLHWLTLDSTPTTSAPPPTPFSWARWWDKARNKSDAVWREMILNYESEQQDAFLRSTWEWLSKDSAEEGIGGQGFSWRPLGFLTLAMGVAVPACWLAIRLRPRRRRRPAARSWAVPFYDRMLALLARHARLHPQAAQTPREFAEAARRFLDASPSTAPLAGIPTRLAALLYRVRYGEQPLTEEENRNAEAELQRLAAGMTG